MADAQPPVDNPDVPSASEQADDNEWYAANADFLLDKGLEKPLDEDKKDDKPNGDKSVPVKSDAGKDTKTGDEADDKKGSDGADDDTKANGKDDLDKADEDKKDTPPAVADRSVRDARATQRQIDADRKEATTEVQKVLFPDFEERILDKDGDEIRTLEDVQAYINPKTQKNFTLEEAGAFLLAAQQAKNKEKVENLAEAERVADLQLDIADQADNIREKYSDLFKNVPGLQKRVWEAFKKTLKTADTDDPKQKLITEMPIPMEEFYDLQLGPHLAQIEALGSDDADDDKQNQQEDDKKKAEDKKKQDEERRRKRADRSDVYSRGNAEVVDDEEEEWKKVAKEYYEG